MKFLIQLILLCTLSILTACSTYRWTDEVLLHDGRIIHVNRTASATEIISFNESMPVRPTPYIYGLKAKNPNTMETISWRSECKHVLPVLLDFDGTDAYLVLKLPGVDYTGDFSEDIKKNYGCTWPPFVFLRRKPNKEWDRIPASEAPAFLKFANLSHVFDFYFMTRIVPVEILQGNERERVLKLSEKERIGFQTIESIQSGNRVAENRQYEFQIEIPRQVSDWKFKTKSRSPSCKWQ
jgi:hypothetical protein